MKNFQMINYLIYLIKYKSGLKLKLKNIIKPLNKLKIYKTQRINHMM